ncbi:MAG: fasciclin domain-containing protein [Planctomycetota bacterium]|nr:fasciclin domain-containing protein [Planctomycetota bacterium]
MPRSHPSLRWASLLGCLLLCLFLATPAGVQAEETQKNIVETAVAAGSFDTLVTAVKAADLAEALSGPGPFTVFAPNDKAFSKLGGTVDALLQPSEKTALQSILTYHVVPGRLTAKQVVKMAGATSLQGQRIDFKVKNGKVFVDGAQVIATDIETSNGIIHVIDSVIIPETNAIPQVAKRAGSFNTLLAAAKAAGLVPALSGDGPLTVFAPTDDAFAKLPQGTVQSLLRPENKKKLAQILTYHVVSGRIYSPDVPVGGMAKTLSGMAVRFKATSNGIAVNGSNIVATDIDASNGVIHVIDAVLLPQTPRDMKRPSRPMSNRMPDAKGDMRKMERRNTIVDVAKGAGSFNTLLAAAKAAGLVETLMGDGPFTVFAPTDAAFKKLPKGTVSSLLQPRNRKALKQILTYHVVPARVFAKDLPADGEARTVAGRSVKIRVENDVRIDNIKVVKADIRASNGVIHVIDEVLLPFEPIRSSTQDVFLAAIDRGVPLFNHGNEEACAAAYEIALKSVLSLDRNLPTVAKRRIQQALDEAAHSKDASKKAWIYRYAMDDVFRGGTRH